MRIRHALFGKSPPPPELPTPDPLPDVTLDGRLTELEALSEKSARVRQHAHAIARREHVRLLSLPFEDIGRTLTKDRSDGH